MGSGIGSPLETGLGGLLEREGLNHENYNPLEGQEPRVGHNGAQE